MSVEASADSRFMLEAIDLARRGWGCTHPNPMVGAVIVEDGQIVGRGWHRQAGGPHAEVEAFNALGRKPASDATLYVTLEPCSTHGTTGACTDVILRSGLQNVVIGAMDKNPAHAGHAVEILRSKGLRVRTDVESDACNALNPIFDFWIQNKRPYTALKIATTLDGKFAAASGAARWVTNAASREDVMHWRRYFPAICVSANTVIADDPSLTSRRDTGLWCPRRFILDRHLKTFEGLQSHQVYTDADKARTTVVCASDADPAKQEVFRAAGIELWAIEASADGLNFNAFLERCAAASIYGVYFEGGPRLSTALIKSGVLHEVFHYLAPKYLNDTASAGIGWMQNTQAMDDAINFKQTTYQQFGDDVCVRGIF